MTLVVSGKMKWVRLFLCSTNSVAVTKVNNHAVVGDEVDTYQNTNKHRLFLKPWFSRIFRVWKEQRLRLGLRLDEMVT